MLDILLISCLLCLPGPADFQGDRPERCPSCSERLRLFRKTIRNYDFTKVKKVARESHMWYSREHVVTRAQVLTRPLAVARINHRLAEENRIMDSRHQGNDVTVSPMYDVTPFNDVTSYVNNITEDEKSHRTDGNENMCTGSPWLKPTFYPEKRDRSLTPIYILALAEIDINRGGWSTAGVIPALQLAVDDVNAREDLLPGYQIIMDIRDTRCDPGHAIYSLVETMRTNPVKLVIVGGGCSTSTAPIATTVPNYGLNQVAYSATSPDFANRIDYPTFFRTATSELAMNPPIVALCLHYDWRYVATIYEYQSLHSTTLNHLHLLLEQANITVLSAESFTESPRESMSNILRKRARIIIFFGYEDAAARVFCQAYNRKMYGSLYQWIIPGIYNQHWWKNHANVTECKPSEIRTALNYTITVTDIRIDLSKQKTESGQTFREYYDRYLNMPSTQKYGVHTYHADGYDAIWAIAFALNYTVKMLREQNKLIEVRLDNGTTYIRQKVLEDFRYGLDTDISVGIWTGLSTLSFHGVSGPVSLKLGERSASMELRQIRGDTGIMFAVYNEDSNGLSIFREVLWHGGCPPIDWPELVKVILYKDKTVIICNTLISLIGVVVGVCFLVFNIKYQDHIHIKMSSPKLNNVIVSGCIASYIGVIAIGPDTHTVSEDVMEFLCRFRPWIMACSFTISFGTIFAKTWRVHSIFTRLSKSTKPLQDYHLLLGVAILFLIDVIILTTWMILDPIQVFYVDIKEEEEQDGQKILHYQNEVCSCEHFWYWVGSLLVTKGLLVIFGCFLAYETRKVSIPSLNDSKYIGFCVYNVVVMSTLGVSISLALSHRETLVFICQALCILINTTTILCLLFIPKISYVRKHPEETVKNRRSGYAGEPERQPPSSTFKFSMRSVYKSTDTLSALCSVTNMENMKTTNLGLVTTLKQKNQELATLRRRYEHLEEMVQRMESITRNPLLPQDNTTVMIETREVLRINSTTQTNDCTGYSGNGISFHSSSVRYHADSTSNYGNRQIPEPEVESFRSLRRSASDPGSLA